MVLRLYKQTKLSVALEYVQLSTNEIFFTDSKFTDFKYISVENILMTFFTDTSRDQLTQMGRLFLDYQAVPLLFMLYILFLFINSIV